MDGGADRQWERHDGWTRWDDGMYALYVLYPPPLAGSGRTQYVVVEEAHRHNGRRG